MLNKKSVLDRHDFGRPDVVLDVGPGPGANRHRDRLPAAAVSSLLLPLRILSLQGLRSSAARLRLESAAGLRLPAAAGLMCRQQPVYGLRPRVRNAAAGLSDAGSVAGLPATGNHYRPPRRRISSPAPTSAADEWFTTAASTSAAASAIERLRISHAETDVLLQSCATGSMPVAHGIVTAACG